MRVLNGVFAALFALGAAVQYNDPDPLRWIAVYAAAFAGCVLWELGRLPRALPIATAVVAAAWGLAIASGMRLTAPFGEALADWSMHAGGSEELREAIGLGLVAVWTTLLAITSSRRSDARPA